MPSQVDMARPSSLDEVEEMMSQWIDKFPKSARAKFRFSRSSKTSRRLSLSTPFQKDVKFRMTHDIFSCEFRGRKLSLQLDCFDVWTQVDSEAFLVEFKVKQTPKFKALAKTLHSVATTEHPVFFSRALNALSEIAKGLSDQWIDEATAAPTDYQVLVEALSASPILSELREAGPLAKAKLRGLVGRKLILEQMGGTLTAEEVADLLDITRQAVDKRRHQHQLIGLTQGRRGYAYPSFQFEDGKTIAGLAEVLKALDAHDPWMQLTFFATGNSHLDGATPLVALRQGKLDSVIRVAETYGEQGAA
jgi:hypothetical protein